MTTNEQIKEILTPLLALSKQRIPNNIDSHDVRVSLGGDGKISWAFWDTRNNVFVYADSEEELSGKLANYDAVCSAKAKALKKLAEAQAELAQLEGEKE